MGPRWAMNISERRGEGKAGAKIVAALTFSIFLAAFAHTKVPQTRVEKSGQRKRSGRRDACRLKNGLKRLTDLAHHHFLLIWPEGMANKGEEKPSGLAAEIEERRRE
jgi:hypothetical protein